MSTEPTLRLQDQLCFRFYTMTRLITKAYQPYLKQMGLTYPQYLVLLVLWEQDAVPISHLVHRLGLNTNTLTPLMKRLEQAGLILRQRGEEDSRQVIITLTEQGHSLRQKAECIPSLLLSHLFGEGAKPECSQSLRSQLDDLFALLERNVEGIDGGDL